MSRASKLTLLGASAFAISTVMFVHYTQSAEKAVSRPCTLYTVPCIHKTLYRRTSANPYATEQLMHAGVIRDMDQQRIKKERQLDFEMQRALEAEYKKVQSVHDGGGPPPAAAGGSRT